MAAKKPSIGVKDFNELISCYLCKGYLIDATTVIECLHSFCKTCIITHLESNTPKSRFCPRCDIQIHKTKPKLNIRSDPTLQDIVYKLVPGLYKNEMNRRKEFYSKEPESAVGLSNEEKGEDCGERLIFTPEDSIYVAIEYFPQVISYSLLPFSKNLSNGSLNVETSSATNGQSDDKNDSQRRYLECQGGMKVFHLKKWLKNKYEVRDPNDIEILYKYDPLLDDYTMIDLAYIYSWRRNGPLCLYYKIIEPQKPMKEECQPFKAPEVVKRRHTLKHKHKLQNNKKRKIIDESNLITTNPVNEPLPPVDSALINRVMASNSIGANLDIMTTVVNSALGMTETTNKSKSKQKVKKSPKNGLKTNTNVKPIKKKLDPNLKSNNKSNKNCNKNSKITVPKETGDNNGNNTNVDLKAGPQNNDILANNSVPNVTEKTEPSVKSEVEHKINGSLEKNSVVDNSITNNIKKTINKTFNSLSTKQLNGVFAGKTKTTAIETNKTVEKPKKSSQNGTKSTNNNNNKQIKSNDFNANKIHEIMKNCLSNMTTPSTNNAVIQNFFNQKVLTAISSPLPVSVQSLRPQTNGQQIKTKSKPKSKTNNISKPLNSKTTITPVPLALPAPDINKSVVGNVEQINGSPKSSQMTNGLSSEKVLKLMKDSVQNHAIKSPDQKSSIKSPLPVPLPVYLSPLFRSPDPNNSFFQFMPFAQNSSNCLPNMSKMDSNSDNSINNDIEVALNLSTSSKDKTT